MVDLFLVVAPVTAFSLAVLPLLDLRIERERDESDDGPPRSGGAGEPHRRNHGAARRSALLIGHIVAESVMRTGA